MLILIALLIGKWKYEIIYLLRWSVENFFHDIPWLRNDLAIIFGNSLQDADGLTMTDILINMLLFDVVTDLGDIGGRYFSFLGIGLAANLLRIGLVVDLYFVCSTWFDQVVLLAVDFRVGLSVDSVVVDFPLLWSPGMPATLDWFVMLIYHIVVMNEIVMVQSICTLFRILPSH